MFHHSSLTQGDSFLGSFSSVEVVTDLGKETHHVWKLSKPEDQLETFKDTVLRLRGRTEATRESVTLRARHCSDQWHLGATQSHAAWADPTKCTGGKVDFEEQEFRNV